MSLTIEEQETHINFSRGDGRAQVSRPTPL